MNISVIIPVYNVEHYVERCIVSIINQTYTEDIECIVVNDCTPDRSMEIVEKLVEQYSGPIQFRLLYHEYNRGLAAVRNTGLNAANGRYIIHIDSDDYCEPDMLEKMYAKATSVNADIVVADFWEEYEDYRIYKKNGEVKSERNTRLKEMLLGKSPGFLWNKLIRRSLFIDNGILSVEEISYAEDLILLYRLYYYANNIVYLPFAFVHYVKFNINSYTNSLSLKSLWEIIKLDQNITSFFLEKELISELSKELIWERIRNRTFLLARSSGNLQKEWNSYYNDIPRSMAIKALFSIASISLMGKIGFVFAFFNMFPIYNFMRTIGSFFRHPQYGKINIYK